MPVFEFRCERCLQIEQRFYQSWQRMVSEPAVRCLADGSRMLRIPSTTAFKVNGFSYANGYAGEKP